MPAILVCNHVSFVDAVLLMAASPRPIRFIMDHRIFRIPVLGWLFRLGKTIPIAPQREDPAGLRARLRAGGGGVARRRTARASSPKAASRQDGSLGEFKGGVMKLLEARAVPVVPMALTNLWGSFFSRIDGTAMTRPFRRGLWSRVGLEAGEPVAPAGVTPALLRERVQRLLAA